MKTKLYTLLILITLSVSNFAQSESDLISFASRICSTDSITKTLHYINEGDSIPTYNFLTPDYDIYGAPQFEFEDFNLSFDVFTNIGFSGLPYGKIHFGDISKKKGEITIELAGVGNRKKEGKWTYATYYFSREKKGRWLLDNVEYFYKEL